MAETHCQSGPLLSLIGRESANKEVHLPETMSLEISPGVRARTGGWVFKGCVRRDQDPHLLGKVFGEMKERGSGLSCWSWGQSSRSCAPRLRVGREMRGEGGGGEGERGGREEEGVRGRNLPWLSASLSALGLGTKGGTLMNSFSRSLDARVSLPRNFVNATFSAVRLRKSVLAPRRLQQWKQCPFKVRPSGGRR